MYLDGERIVYKTNQDDMTLGQIRRGRSTKSMVEESDGEVVDVEHELRDGRTCSVRWKG